ncbi:hypothetical protein EMIT0P294_11241 [Pseudomonas sp. IT-P294]
MPVRSSLLDEGWFWYRGSQRTKIRISGQGQSICSGKQCTTRSGQCDDHHNIRDIALRLLSFDLAAPESLMGRALRVAMEYDFSIHIHSIGVASDCR